MKSPETPYDGMPIVRKKRESLAPVDIVGITGMLPNRSFVTFATGSMISADSFAGGDAGRASRRRRRRLDAVVGDQRDLGHGEDWYGGFGRDALHAEMFHDRVVQRLVARFLADLDHAGNLVRLGFAHKVCDGSVEYEDFQRGHAPLLINAFEQVLRHDAFERFGKCRADLVLLVSGEYVDDTIHRLGSARRVKRAED